MKYTYTTPYGVAQKCDLSGIGFTHAVVVKNERTGTAEWRVVLGARSHEEALAESERLAKRDWTGRVYSEVELWHTSH